jgi:hypothetical protein
MDVTIPTRKDRSSFAAAPGTAICGGLVVQRVLGVNLRASTAVWVFEWYCPWRILSAELLGSEDSVFWVRAMIFASQRKPFISRPVFY